MPRTLLLVLVLLLPGCGEAERPRFVPATGDAPSASSVDRKSGDKASPEVVIPKNIPMH